MSGSKVEDEQLKGRVREGIVEEERREP